MSTMDGLTTGLGEDGSAVSPSFPVAWMIELNRVQFETHRFRVKASPSGRLWKAGTYGFQTGRGLETVEVIWLENRLHPTGASQCAPALFERGRHLNHPVPILQQHFQRQPDPPDHPPPPRSIGPPHDCRFQCNPSRSQSAVLLPCRGRAAVSGRTRSPCPATPPTLI
jgi:hypothetical protein